MIYADRKISAFAHNKWSHGKCKEEEDDLFVQKFRCVCVNEKAASGSEAACLVLIVACGIFGGVSSENIQFPNSYYVR